MTQSSYQRGEVMLHIIDQEAVIFKSSGKQLFVLTEIEAERCTEDSFQAGDHLVVSAFTDGQHSYVAIVASCYQVHLILVDIG